MAIPDTPISGDRSRTKANSDGQSSDQKTEFSEGISVSSSQAFDHSGGNSEIAGNLDDLNDQEISSETKVGGGDTLVKAEAPCKRQLTDSADFLELCEELPEQEIRDEDRLRFIGILFKENMVPEETVHDLIKELLGTDPKSCPADEAYVEAVSQLLRITGSQLDRNQESRCKNDENFKRLEELSTNPQPATCSESIRDFLALRKWYWKKQDVNSFANWDQPLARRSASLNLRLLPYGTGEAEAPPGYIADPTLPQASQLTVIASSSPAAKPDSVQERAGSALKCLPPPPTQDRINGIKWMVKKLYKEALLRIVIFPSNWPKMMPKIQKERVAKKIVKKLLKIAQRFEFEGLYQDDDFLEELQEDLLDEDEERLLPKPD